MSNDANKQLVVKKFLEVPVNYTGIVNCSGDVYHLVGGSCHNDDDQPAIIRRNGTKEWYRYGSRHREIGPAVTWTNGYKVYYLNGKKVTETEQKALLPKELLIQTDYSFVMPNNYTGEFIDMNGNKFQYKNGLLHHEVLPSRIFLNGTKEWWLNNRLHRLNGPAVINIDGSTHWYQDGQKHREDGPAIERPDGTNEWYKKAKRHREDGPAIEFVNGDKKWYKDNKKHREDGPADVYSNGTKEWFVNDQRHRLDGPAIEHFNGDKEWHENGQLHRLDGPAREFINGTKEWWINNQLHRDNEPAIMSNNGDQFWYCRGQLHRDNAPARIYSDGLKEWCQHGRLHRLDGPAREYPTGDKQFFIYGQNYNEEQFYKLPDVLEVLGKLNTTNIANSKNTSQNELKMSEDVEIKQVEVPVKEKTIYDFQDKTEDWIIPTAEVVTFREWADIPENFKGIAVLTTGGKYYLWNKRLHREDGPAIVYSIGHKEWYLKGHRHRVDGPAVIYPSGNIEYWQNGEVHRENGPAVISKNHTSYYVNGRKHREDGPAVEYASGRKEWYKDGQLHRITGPAVEDNEGNYQYWRNGKRHRTGSPAIESADGRKEYWIDGKLHKTDGPAIIYADGKKENYLFGYLVTELIQSHYRNLINNVKLHTTTNELVELTFTGRQIIHNQLSQWWINGQKVVFSRAEDIVNLILKFNEILGIEKQESMEKPMTNKKTPEIVPDLSSLLGVEPEPTNPSKDKDKDLKEFRNTLDKIGVTLKKMVKESFPEMDEHQDSALSLLDDLGFMLESEPGNEPSLESAPKSPKLSLSSMMEEEPMDGVDRTFTSFDTMESIPRDFTGIAKVKSHSINYLKHGALHRLDGPAKIWHHSKRNMDQYWLEGVQLSADEFLDELKNTFDKLPVKELIQKNIDLDDVAATIGDRIIVLEKNDIAPKNFSGIILDVEGGHKTWYVDGKIHRSDNLLPAVINDNGNREWWHYGQRHREGDLPAVEREHGYKAWLQYDKLHRITGPAVYGYEGIEKPEYFVNGVYFTPEAFKEIPLVKRYQQAIARIPKKLLDTAIVCSESELHNRVIPENYTGLAITTFENTANKEYVFFTNGKIGRSQTTNEPAIIYANGALEWRLNDQLHNEQGPAIINSTGEEEYWLQHVRVSKEEFTKRTRVRRKNFADTEIFSIIPPIRLPSYYLQSRTCIEVEQESHIPTDYTGFVHVMSLFPRWIHVVNGKKHREDGPAVGDNLGHTAWYSNGLKHREDGPAVTNNYGKFWFYENKLHRLDGPAAERTNGLNEWYIHNQLFTEQDFNKHPEVIAYKSKFKGTFVESNVFENKKKGIRWSTFLQNQKIQTFKTISDVPEDYTGTAKILMDNVWCTRKAYKGQLHCVDGPAVEYEDGRKEWLRNGVNHRLDGPAVLYPENNYKAYFIDGRQYDKNQYYTHLKVMESNSVIELTDNELVPENYVGFVKYKGVEDVFWHGTEDSGFKVRGFPLKNSGIKTATAVGVGILAGSMVNKVVEKVKMNSDTIKTVVMNDQKESVSPKQPKERSLMDMLKSDSKIAARRIATKNVLDIAQNAIITLMTKDMEAKQSKPLSAKQSKTIKEEMTIFFGTPIGRSILSLMLGSSLPLFEQYIPAKYKTAVQILSEEFRVEAISSAGSELIKFMSNSGLHNIKNIVEYHLAPESEMVEIGNTKLRVKPSKAEKHETTEKVRIELDEKQLEEVHTILTTKNTKR